MFEPLDTGEVKHFLEFVNDDSPRIEIDEPIGFDAANFVVEQGTGRYGRDISFAGEEIDFTFSSISVILGHEFEKLVEFYTIYGFESEVKYIIQISGSDYVIGQLDYQTAIMDQIKSFSSKVIQSTTQASIKRRIEVKVDLFSDLDLDGNPITSVGTQNILLKAKPIIQNSAWRLSTPFWVFTSANNPNATIVNSNRQNPINIITDNGITDTLSYLNRFITQFSGSDADEIREKIFDLVFVEAENDLTDVEVNVDSVKISYFIETGSVFLDPLKWFPNTGTLDITFKYFIFSSSTETFTLADVFDSGTINLDFNVEFIGNENVDRFGNFTGTADRYDVTIGLHGFVVPIVPRDHRLCLYFEVGRNSAITEWLSATIDITAVSTAIDSVTKGVRLVDAMKQVSSSINPVFINSMPRFEFGGEWYDNFIFSGNMIRGLDKPFVLSWKEAMQGITEFNADYEVDEENLFVGKYDDFYTNIESGCFLTIPDDTFELSFNEIYTINEFVFNYKTFNQDKDDVNTVDSVHTITEWLFQNKLVENTKVVDVPFIRDPLMLETTRIKSTKTKATTSLSQDDKIFILDVVPLAPSTIGGFRASVTHFLDELDNLQLLNDNTYNWALLGFDIGSTFTIVDTSNADDYIVTNLSSNIITLTAVNITPSTIDLKLTKVEYAFTNVAFTNRTNEGFDLIENIDAPDKYSNLLYTPKRNIINNWSSYISAASRYNPVNIDNRYFKNGGNLTTQFNGGEILTEKDNLTQDQLQQALLTPEIITTKVISDFGMFRDLTDSIKTDRGFIRVFDNQERVRRIYPIKIDFVWAKNIMTITGEVKFETYITDISFDSSASVYIINETGYDQDIVPQLEHRSEGDYITLYDSITRPLINRTRFDRVSVNGVVFNTLLELINAIELL